MIAVATEIFVPESTHARARGAASLRDNWWRRGANATLQLARKQGWRARADRFGADSIGRDWDGRSDVKLGKETVAAKSIAAVVAGLAQGLVARKVPLAKLPDRRSVRFCASFLQSLATLVIDVDFGEFILPVSIDGYFLAKHPNITAAEIGSAMADLVLRTHQVRDQTAAQETRLRDAFEEQSSLAGVVPLWLRMSPRSLGWSHDVPQTEVYEMTVLKLDEDLRQTMGDLLTTWTGDIALYLQSHGKTQSRRAAIRARLEAAGSAGFISEVALGLVEARGMEPGEVFSSLGAARLAGDHGVVVHRTDTTRETLTLVEGVIDATIEFQGGSYEPGKLTLDGDYPRTMAIGAKGRPLTAFVDHPAFQAADVKIKRALALPGRLRLYHQVRTMAIEQATGASHSNAKHSRDRFDDPHAAWLS